MTKKHVSVAATAAALIVISLSATLGSYTVVTGRNVKLDPLKEYITIDGKNIVNLPCGTDDVNWVSNDPVMPESRGIPLNYNFWNPCHGHKILRDGLIIDFGFWLVVFSGLYVSYLKYNAKHKSGNS
jgi:hypothetical protein